MLARRTLLCMQPKPASGRLCFAKEGPRIVRRTTLENALDASHALHFNALAILARPISFARCLARADWPIRPKKLRTFENNSKMKKTADMPLWVYFAFASIETRKAAVWLVGSCVVFTAYCIPWANFYDNQEWVKVIFLLDDWSWFGSMVPLTLWYYLSLRWLDQHARWDEAA
jgi:hypothetical protein